LTGEEKDRGKLGGGCGTSNNDRKDQVVGVEPTSTIGKILDDGCGANVYNRKKLYGGYGVIISDRKRPEGKCGAIINDRRKAGGSQY
jgi:hypothetical protein